MTTMIRGVLASSRVDAHGECLSEGVLEHLADVVNNCYLPICVQHDPRIPPVGLFLTAALERQPDGSLQVVGEGEIFDDGDCAQIGDDAREMPADDGELGTAKVSYDRSFRDEEGQLLVSEIAALLGHAPIEVVKKSVEPVEVLVLAMSFMLGSIASGFLKKVGADGWDKLKRLVARAMERRREPGRERLFVLQVQVATGERDARVAVETILENPDQGEVEAFFRDYFPRIDEVVRSVVSGEVPLRRVVAVYRDGEPRLLYGVRPDAVPVPPSRTRVAVPLPTSFENLGKAGGLSIEGALRRPELAGGEQVPTRNGSGTRSRPAH